MVDAIVSFAIGKLGDYLINEVVFLQSVRGEVEWLQHELEWMKCFLKDAEEKQEGDNRSELIRKWIADVRDVAYGAEDIIDTFIIQVKVEGTQGSSTAPKVGFLASIKKCSCFLPKEIHKEYHLYNIGKEIEGLKANVDQIHRRQQLYGIERDRGIVEQVRVGAIGDLRQLRRTSSYGDDERVVGFEDVAASLIEKLLKQDPRRCVISILGMGGLGKTTLARKLYHHSDVVEGFRCCAWICVSQEYTVEDLLRRIIKSFKPCTKEELEMLEKMTHQEDLERYLRKFLEGSPYLVVIDDVWHEEAWKSLKRAFPDNNNGSRVIVTTRIRAVAERSDEITHVHELRFLRPDESWELFCKKAFPSHSAMDGDTSLCPSNLETMGREMVEKCDGLPLAIIVLGGLLSRKKPDEWQSVKEHICRDLRNHTKFITQILTLSYSDLPNQLKPCFLYMGLFPEDSEIDSEKLIHLWVAEGFISPEEDTSEEEVADKWLNELIGRSLIQVARTGWRRFTACRVHDLLRDLAVQKAKELNFLHVYDGTINSASPSNAASSHRRQATHSLTIQRYASVDYSNPSLRTLLFFEPYGRKKRYVDCLKIIFARFRLLRVLDLCGCSFSDRTTNLPDAIGELLHLRYLGLRGTYIEELPPSIVNLQALQTLDVFSRDTMVRVGGDLGQLKQLRHLIGAFEGNPLQIDHLTNLQTLKFVNVGDWMRINTVNLTNLRELHLQSSSSESDQSSEFTLDSISNLRNLRSLTVLSFDPLCIPSIQPLSHCRQLIELKICKRIENLPDKMHDYLPNLKHLQLSDCQLLKDPMPALEKLPNLLVLHLEIYVPDLKKLTCTAKGFPRLEVLMLLRLHWLEELEVEEGTMPMLKGLTIRSCDVLMLPEKFRSIPDAMSLNWDWGPDWESRYSEWVIKPMAFLGKSV